MCVCVCVCFMFIICCFVSGHYTFFDVLRKIISSLTLNENSNPIQKHFSVSVPRDIHLHYIFSRIYYKTPNRTSERTEISIISLVFVVHFVFMACSSFLCVVVVVVLCTSGLLVLADWQARNEPKMLAQWFFPWRIIRNISPHHTTSKTTTRRISKYLCSHINFFCYPFHHDTPRYIQRMKNQIERNSIPS